MLHNRIMLMYASIATKPHVFFFPHRSIYRRDLLLTVVKGWQLLFIGGTSASLSAIAVRDIRNAHLKSVSPMTRDIYPAMMS